MAEIFEKDFSGTETKEITELDKNILKQVLGIWHSMHNDIFVPIAETENDSEVDPEGLQQDIGNFVDLYKQLVEKYGQEVENYSYQIFSDFQTYLTKLFEVLEGYGGFDGLTEKYRRSPIVRKLVEGMFKLNGKFYSLYTGLRRDNLRAGVRYISLPGINDGDNYSYINMESINSTIDKIFYEKMNQIGEVWTVVYRPLLELVKKELGTLIEETGEEKFKNKLKDSYIGEFITVESGKNFPRSCSILKDKLENLDKYQTMEDLGVYLKITGLDKLIDDLGTFIKSIIECFNGTRKGNKM